jgi:hypothetical protein
MASKQSKPLTHEDTLSAEEARQLEITDEIAQKMGFANAKLFNMERELIDLAAGWRETQDENILKDYHRLYYKMIVFGWDPLQLDAEAELLPKDMPELPEKTPAEPTPSS